MRLSIPAGVTSGRDGDGELGRGYATVEVLAFTGQHVRTTRELVAGLAAEGEVEISELHDLAADLARRPHVVLRDVRALK